MGKKFLGFAVDYAISRANMSGVHLLLGDEDLSKIDDIRTAMPSDAANAFELALTTKASNGKGFLLSAAKVADLVTDLTPWSVSKDAVLNWRHRNASE